MNAPATDMTNARPPKVMITKIGLDGHDRGSRVIAAHLRDQGMDEDIDVLGVSSLATDHLLVPKLMKALGEAGLTHVKVIVGGIVPDEDERELLDAGVSRVFHPGSSLEEIAEAVTELTQQARSEAGDFSGGQS